MAARAMAFGIVRPTFSFPRKGFPVGTDNNIPWRYLRHYWALVGSPHPMGEVGIEPRSFSSPLSLL